MKITWQYLLTFLGVGFAVTLLSSPAMAQTWVKCANENAICKVPGTNQVRYGANGKYATRTATSSIGCNNSVFGDPIYGTYKSCEYAVVAATPTPAPAPTATPSSTASWVKCASEYQVCNFSGTRDVRYGANGKYAMKIATNSINCNNEVFGDPVYGTAKICEYSSSVRAPASTATPVVIATPTPAPTAAPAPAVPAGALISTSDARILTVLDAAVAIGQTDVRLVTQLADNQQYNNFRLRNVPNPGVLHNDGSPWLARVTVPDGSNKPAYLFRMKQGQPLFQGSTLRSELFAGYQDANVGVREGQDYWMGIEWYFDNDMFDTGGVGQFGPDGISLFDLHGQPGFAGTPASELHGMAFRLTQNRRMTFNTFARAGVDGKVYDLTNGPSSSAIGTNGYDPSGAHGTANEYVLDNNAQAGVWYRFAVRMKLAATADRAPQLQVYRKKGNGPIVKILDTQAPNTGGGIGSYRYQKSGIYKFDGVFGNKPTRSFYRRGWIIIKNEPGSPALDQNAIMNWLER